MTTTRDVDAASLVAAGELAGQRESRVLGRLLDLPALWWVDGAGVPQAGTSPDGSRQQSGLLREALDLAWPADVDPVAALLGDVGPVAAGLLTAFAWTVKGRTQDVPRDPSDVDSVSMLRSLSESIAESHLPDGLRDDLLTVCRAEQAEAWAACQSPQARAALVRRAAQELATSRSGTALSALSLRMRTAKVTGPVRELVTGTREQPWPDAQWCARMRTALEESAPTALAVVYEIDLAAVAAGDGDTLDRVASAWRESVADQLDAVVSETQAWRDAFETAGGSAVLVLTWPDKVQVPGVLEAWSTPEAGADDLMRTYRSGTVLQVPWVIAEHLSSFTSLAWVPLDVELTDVQMSTLVRLAADAPVAVTSDALAEMVAVACALDRAPGAPAWQVPARRRVVPAQVRSRN